MHPPLDIDLRIPLIVDLDGTLLLADTLHEGLIHLACSDLPALAVSLTLIPNGRAAFKRGFAQHPGPDPATLPARADLVALLAAERARGRALHLVTAADQSVADAYAARFGVFTTARGSDGGYNLKGEGKRDYLAQQFPEGFVYAGDHATDLAVFRAARGAILCDVDARTARAVRAANIPVLAEFRRPVPTWRTWVRTFRLHQWSKNILVFVPLFVGHQFGDPAKAVAAALGFVLLSVIASATYMINDLVDLTADRQHARKRYRPFASGTVPVAFGIVAAPLMIAGSLIVATVVSPALALALLAYLVLTLAYSFGLKQVPLLDVFIIGLLFTLRIVVGAQALDLGYSPWLLSFSLTFFLSLALSKRHGEIVRAAHAEIGELAGRGYSGDDWPVTLTFGVGAGLTSVVIMLLYLTNDAAPSGFYQKPFWLYAVPILVLIWLMRIWLLANRMQLHHDPVVFALRDRASLVLGVATAIAFFLAL